MNEFVKKYSHYIMYALIVTLLLMATSSLYSWYKQTPVITPTQYTEPPKIREVVKIKTIRVPGPKEIITIEKEAVVKKLHLPDSVAKDVNKQVTATAEIAPYEGKTNVVSVTDTVTGESNLIAKQQPLPLFAFENKKEIGIRAGMSTTGSESDLYGRWTFLRVGNMHTAAYGEIDQKFGVKTTSDAKVMLDLSYRW